MTVRHQPSDDRHDEGNVSAALEHREQEFVGRPSVHIGERDSQIPKRSQMVGKKGVVCKADRKRFGPRARPTYRFVTRNLETRMKKRS